ncbi:hypothetical protein EDB85DRAFT_2143999 [Lactarius pseudohatsudake]|nr:hypothetical protein EDB85DRAFT_2143999 [Lactarius pseudohatsudake]
MSDSPPPKSSSTRFLNWTMPAEIFDGWAAQLDKCALYQEFEDRERVLRHHLTLLRVREDVGYCSRATDAILFCHAQFAYLMAQRIDDASRSWLKGAEHVAHMQGNLKSFVSALEKMEVQKKSSTARRILGWLKYLFNALASIFALGSFVSPFLHSVAPGLSLIAPAASTLWKAAAAFCGQACLFYTALFCHGDHNLDAEIRAGKESESIESVLLFLKDIVPKEAHIAQKSLARFDEALLVMGLEARMKTGRWVALRGPKSDLTAVAQEWRKIAKQYQSMLPDDEDPDG